jgi:hypothetical protein
MNSYIAVYALIAISAISGCKDSTTVIGPIGQQNLIVNGSFEQSGNPSIDGWRQSYPDTSFVQFSTDAPPNGGSYSASLRNGWGPLPILQAFVPAEVGVHRYTLSVWSKALPPVGPFTARGGLAISHKTIDTLLYRKRTNFADSVWTEHVLLDTLSAQQGDTLVISLSTGQGQWSAGRTLFDLVTFSRLD